MDALKDETSVVEAVDVETIASIDPKLLKKTIRRMDLITIPILTMVFAVCLIDRVNIGLAAVAGMIAELNLVGYQYSICLLVFFPGYTLFTIPSNYILVKTSVRFWLTCLTIGFGTMTLVMGFSRNFATLAALRSILGLFEAGVFPAIIFILGSWYPRYYLGKRITFFFGAATFLGSLAGVLAWCFSRINVGSYRGWRWIFLLEGALTILFAGVAYMALDEYPSKSRFLTIEQRKAAEHLLQADRQQAQEDEQMTFASVFRTLRDWKLWVYAFMYMFATVTAYATTYFIPLILNAQMGFSGAISQLLTTPPYTWAFIMCMIIGSLSDHYKLRTPFITFNCLGVIMGVTLTRWGPNTGSQYLGIFLTLGGGQVNVGMILSFCQNNCATTLQRGVGSGLQLSLGAVGGIIGSLVFRSQDAPTYTPGISVIIGCTIVLIFVSATLGLFFRGENRRHEETGKILQPGYPDFVYAP